MKKALEIRYAAPHEALVLTNLAMRSKAYWGYTAEFMAACRDELQVSPEKIECGQCHYRIAEISGKIIGFYALEQLSGFECELDALFVEPMYIGTGVGRALICNAKSLAVSLGAHKLIIQGDPNAEQFYVKMGAKRTGNKESFSLPGRFLPTFEILL